MTSQPGQQIITINIFPNIARSKENQTMKFVSQQNITREIFVFKNYAGNEAGRLLQNSIRAFQNGLGQLRDVCSFEDIESIRVYFD